MFTKLSKTGISAATFTAAAAVATGLVATMGATQASAASTALGGSHIALHFNLAAGQTPENIALDPDGNQYVTFAKARQVAEIFRSGRVRVLATMPLPADGGVHTPALGFPLTVGITRAADGTIYFLYATGTADLTGVWRMHPGNTPERIAALPAAGLPNGLKIHDGAIWATNLDKGTVLRIPILPNGTAGAVQIKATGLAGIDDFAFTGHGDQILAALDTVDEVALVQPDGTHTIILTAADGLQGPSSVAVRGDTAYIMSAAYLTATDPNEITAHLND